MRRVAEPRAIARGARPVGHDATVRHGPAGRDSLQSGPLRETPRDQFFEFPEGRLWRREVAARPGGVGGPKLVHGVQPFNFVIV